ncbi:MAG: DUF3617 family protein [Holophagales bacterium]|nr:MAG: DUF3617 family protein [Holophagales bacterium]
MGRTTSNSRRCAGMALLLAAALVLLAASALRAAEPSGPSLRPGRWRLERSFEYADRRPAAGPVVSEICFDPEVMANEMIAMFRRMGCTAERSRTGPSEWRHRVECDRPELPRGTSTSVTTVRGTDAYEARIVNEGGMAMPVVRERLVARRLGDC